MTELALLAAHERDCPDCRTERESAQALLASRAPVTRSRALRRVLSETIGAARVGAAMVSAGVTRGRTALSPALTTAGVVSTRAMESYRLGSARLKLSARHLARVPDVTVVIGRAMIRPVRGAHAALLDRGRTAAATITVAAGYVRRRGVGLPARLRNILTPETGFLLRVCAGIAALGILAMTLVFAWPRQGPDNKGPDKASSRASDAPRPPDREPTGPVAATPPRAERETLAVVPAPPPAPVKMEARKTMRPASPGPQPEIATPERLPAPATEREHAAPDTPDPSAAIDWLLKGAGGTGRRDIDRP